jgi:hypothetical protein
MKTPTLFEVAETINELIQEKIYSPNEHSEIDGTISQQDNSDGAAKPKLRF